MLDWRPVHDPSDNFTETLDNSDDFDDLEKDDLTDANRVKQQEMKVWMAKLCSLQ